MRQIGLLLALGACGFSSKSGSNIGDGSMMIDGPDIDAPDIDAPPIDGPPGSARLRTITIPDAKIFGNLTDFPIWLVIDDMPGLGAKASAQGNDIYFTLPNGTPLEWERVAWDKASGHLEAWVKVSLVDGQANVIDLRFGDPGPAHAPNAPMVWTNGFLAVWHLEDTLAAGNTTIAEARGVVAGTAVNTPTPVTGGKLGRAIDFNNADEEITFTNPLANNNSMTISAWISAQDPADGFGSIVCVGNNANGQSRFLHANYPELGYGFFGNGNDVQTNVDVTNGQFTLLHLTYNSGTNEAALYRDGAQVGTAVDVPVTVNTMGNGGHIGNAPMQWGPGGNTPNPLNGIIDEVRIASAPRPLEWIRTEHANQSDVKMFYMLGPDVPAQ